MTSAPRTANMPFLCRNFQRRSPVASLPCRAHFEDAGAPIDGRVAPMLASAIMAAQRKRSGPPVGFGESSEMARQRSSWTHHALAHPHPLFPKIPLHFELGLDGILTACAAFFESGLALHLLNETTSSPRRCGGASHGNGTPCPGPSFKPKPAMSGGVDWPADVSARSPRSLSHASNFRARTGMQARKLVTRRCSGRPAESIALCLPMQPGPRERGRSGSRPRGSIRRVGQSSFLPRASIVAHDAIRSPGHKAHVPLLADHRVYPS